MLGFFVLSSDQVKTTSCDEIYNAVMCNFYHFFHHLRNHRWPVLFECILFSVRQLQIESES